MHPELSASSDPPAAGDRQVDALPLGDHLVEITERGSFAFAVCDCGWFAPARRSRDRARRDAAEHLTAPGFGDPG